MTPRHHRLASQALLPVLTILLSAGGVDLSAQSRNSQDPQPPADRPASQEPDHAEPPASALFVRAFGTVNWGATNQQGVPNSFALGQFALFATSTLGERVSVLAEVVMEGGQNTRVVTDLERLQLTFRFDDHLQLSAGRFHTRLGYYNAAFHHGTYFETPIGRPRVFAFEDEGGVLPVHEVGLSAGGMVPGTGATLRYFAEVGNGRAWSTTGADIDEAADANSAKATNLGLSFQPGRWRALEIGTSHYRDTIPRGDLRPVSHRIATAFAVYRTPLVEVMGEWLRLSHRTEEGARYVNHAGYFQVSRAWGKLRPYYRHDRLSIDAATPFIGQTGSYSAQIIGLRIDPGQWVGLKAQYEHTNETRQRGIDSIRTQLVFVF